MSICLKILSVLFSGVDSSSGIFITDDTILYIAYKKSDQHSCHVLIDPIDWLHEGSKQTIDRVTVPTGLKTVKVGKNTAKVEIFQSSCAFMLPFFPMFICISKQTELILICPCRTLSWKSKHDCRDKKNSSLTRSEELINLQQQMGIRPKKTNSNELKQAFCTLIDLKNKSFKNSLIKVLD